VAGIWAERYRYVVAECLLCPVQERYNGSGDGLSFLAPTILNGLAIEFFEQDLGESLCGRQVGQFVVLQDGAELLVDQRVERDEALGGKDVEDIAQGADGGLQLGGVRDLGLVDGEIDVDFEIPSDSLARLRKMRYKIAEGLNAHIWYLSLNMKNKYTKDLKVRQAINMAINKKAMAEELLKGVASPASQIAGYGTPGYVPELYQMYPYDPEKAKNVLSEAGYPDGFDLVFWIPTGGSGELEPLNMAEWIQNDLRKVGIRVKLETFEWLSYVDMWAKGMPEEVGINQMSWGMLTDWWFNHPYRNFNTSNIQDEEMISMLIKAEQVLDNKERIELYKKFNRLDREKAYHVPIVNGRRTWALSPRVKGWIHTLEWGEQLRTVWLEKK